MPDPFTTAFAAALQSGALPPGVTARDPAEAPRRFAVYRNNVAHGLSRALATRFPVIERLLGAEFFAALAPLFVAAHPPASPRLFEWGGAFPDFLRTFPPLAGLPYLADVARLELARGVAYHAADLAPLSPAALAALAVAPDTARLALHPSVQVIASDHAVGTIWAANQPGSPPRDITDRPEVVAVLRDRGLSVQVWPLTPPEAAFVTALRDSLPLLAAAQAATCHAPRFDPAPLIGRLMQAGAFIAPSKETP
jgi:hypothetical protein